MDPAELTTLVAVLESAGPWGVVCLVLVGVRRIYRDLKTVNERVVALTEQQTAVMVRVDASLQALREAILLAHRLPAPPPYGPAARPNGTKSE